MDASDGSLIYFTGWQLRFDKAATKCSPDFRIMPINNRRNPFYLLLVAVGVAFVVTAFAYGVMAFQSVSSLRRDSAGHGAHPLFAWLKQHGDQAMLCELAVLGGLTVAAIATDRWWSRSSPSDRNSTRAKRAV
jgi:hypothetical protein